MDFDVKAYAQRLPWTFVSTSDAEPPEEVQLVLGGRRRPRVANEDFGTTAVSASSAASAATTSTSTIIVRLREHRVRGRPRSSPRRARSRYGAATACAARASLEENSTRSRRATACLRRSGGRRRWRRRCGGRQPASAACCYIVPYVAKRRGRAGSTSSRRCSAPSTTRCSADLELLSQVGPPDGDIPASMPAGLGRGRPRVRRGSRTASTRPLRLTARRGCSLLLGIRAAARSGIAPFDAAMQLRREQADGGASAATPTRGRGTPRDLRHRGRQAGRRRSPRHLREARHRGARGRRRVEIDYVSCVRATSTSGGRLDPYGVGAPRRRVVRRPGFCHKRGDVRTFRIDRIAAHRPDQRGSLRAARRLRSRGLPARPALRAADAMRRLRGPPRTNDVTQDRREQAGRRGHRARRRLEPRLPGRLP